MDDETSRWTKLLVGHNKLYGKTNCRAQQAGGWIIEGAEQKQAVNLNYL